MHVCLATTVGSQHTARTPAVAPTRPDILAVSARLLHRRLVYGAHFYDGFYVQPLWQLLGEGVTCALMTGFLDSRVAVLLNEVRHITARQRS